MSLIECTSGAVAVYENGERLPVRFWQGGEMVGGMGGMVVGLIHPPGAAFFKQAHMHGTTGNGVWTVSSFICYEFPKPTVPSEASLSPIEGIREVSEGESPSSTSEGLKTTSSVKCHGLLSKKDSTPSQDD